MKLTITVLAIAVLAIACSIANAVTITYATSVGGGIKDSDNATWLEGSFQFMIDFTAGDYVALIEDAGLDGKDNIQAAGGAAVIGDDVLVTDSIVGYLMAMNGEFNGAGSATAAIGDAFYLRAFNDRKANLGAGDWYWESELYYITEGTVPGTPGDLDIIIQGGYTDLEIIPEPSTLLVGLSLLLLRKKR